MSYAMVSRTGLQQNHELIRNVPKKVRETTRAAVVSFVVFL